MKLPLVLAASLLIGCFVGETDDEDDDVMDDAPEVSAADLAGQLTIAGVPIAVHFTNPPANGGNDRTILNETVRLIANTPPGGHIRAAIHSLSLPMISNALIAAQTNGVIVEVAEDGSDEFDSAPGKALAAALGARHVFCGDQKRGGRAGCITDHPSGIMHTKLYTFSQTRDPGGTLRDNVVWFGSANMTGATGAESFNNTITVYGDRELFDAMNRYFRQLFEQRHFARNDFYDAQAERGFVATPTARVFASPSQSHDLVLERLNDIKPDASCRIRVAQAMIFDSRLEIVDLLAKLKRGNCKVWVAGNKIQPKALAKLRAARIPIRTDRVHDKYILVNAKFADSTTNRFLVFTGSHNWTESANTVNDELFVRLESKALYDKFYGHFKAAYDAGERP